MKLLLVSSSVVFGTGYLEHCEAAVTEHFSEASSVLFVPFALYDRDGYAAKVRERFAQLGKALVSLHDTPDPLNAIRSAEGIFTGGGNTFRLVDELQRREYIQPLRQVIRDGVPYMGTSAGSNIAAPTIRTTNDMPIVEPPSFEALDLVNYQINPHYLDPAPGSQHQGETREQRLTEFLEENVTPVVAIREGAWIQVDGSQSTLAGSRGGRLFRRGHETVELYSGDSISALLS